MKLKKLPNTFTLIVAIMVGLLSPMVQASAQETAADELILCYFKADVFSKLSWFNSTEKETFKNLATSSAEEAVRLTSKDYATMRYPILSQKFSSMRPNKNDLNDWFNKTSHEIGECMELLGKWGR